MLRGLRQDNLEGAPATIMAMPNELQCGHEHPEFTLRLSGGRRCKHLHARAARHRGRSLAPHCASRRNSGANC